MLVNSGEYQLRQSSKWRLKAPVLCFLDIKLKDTFNMSKKDAEIPLQNTDSSKENFWKRMEVFCKLLATLIVVIGISVHLARILKDGVFYSRL